MFTRHHIFIGILLATFNLNVFPQAEQGASIAEKKIVVFVAGYNNKDWCKKNLDSIFCQQYENYRVIYIDDNSPDGMGELVERYIIEKGQESRVTLIRNTTRKWLLANQYPAIHSCDDHDIVVIVDADDWLAHENVLTLINEVYSTEDVWLTYGQYICYPSGEKGLCRPIPLHIIEKNEFRKFGWVTSHLRTFYAGLYKKINYEDLLYNGKPFQISVDQATMYPMVEMAGFHIKFIPDILYIYNRANARPNWNFTAQLSHQMSMEIRKRKPYEKIETLFEEDT